MKLGGLLGSHPSMVMTLSDFDGGREGGIEVFGCGVEARGRQEAGNSPIVKVDVAFPRALRPFGDENQIAAIGAERRGLFVRRRVRGRKRLEAAETDRVQVNVLAAEPAGPV